MQSPAAAESGKGRCILNPDDCLRLLQLGPAASLEEIKRAYRRLALTLHPDRHAGDEHVRKRFIEVSIAYRTLIRIARATDQNEKVGRCWNCHSFGEVIVGPDGQPRCPQCIFKPDGGRLLPPPAMVMAKCISTFVLLAGAVYFLILVLSTGRTVYGLAGIACGLAGLATLAYTCITVIHCFQPRDRFVQRTMSRRKHR